MYRHVLIAATYESDKAIPSSDLTRVVRDGLSDMDVEPERIISYTQSFRMTPMAAGLVEVWQNMSQDEREDVSPKLTNAILMLLGVETHGT